jgi:hypothetical protein
MAIGKVESASPVVVVGRDITHAELRRVARVNAVHAGHEMAIVDTLRTLVDEHPNPRRIAYVADLAKQREPTWK